MAAFYAADAIAYPPNEPVAGSYEDSFIGPDGTLITGTGKYLSTWAKQPDGTWKAIHDIWNADARQQ